MKRILFILALLVATTGSYAQTNANEAKAAYMLAEENYGKGDYKTALEYLQQAKSALGTSNCKVAYLEIMVTRELNAKNPRQSEKILPLIAAFEKLDDYKDFNEEKTLEITKIKLAMKLEQKALREKDEKEAAVREAEKRAEAALDKIFSKYPPLDLTVDELDARFPDLKAKKWRTNKTYASVMMSPNMEQNFNRERYPFGKIEKDFDFEKNKVVSFQLRYSSGTQKIFTYAGMLVYADQNVKPAGDLSAMAQADAVLEQYTKEMGKPVNVNDFDDKDAHYTVYRWKTKNKQLDVCKLYYPKSSVPIVKLIEEVRLLDSK